MRSCAVPICVRSTLISATSGTSRVCSARTSTSLFCASTICSARPSQARLERLELGAPGELIFELADPRRR